MGSGTDPERGSGRDHHFDNNPKIVYNPCKSPEQYQPDPYEDLHCKVSQKTKEVIGAISDQINKLRAERDLLLIKIDAYESCLQKVVTEFSEFHPK